MSYCRHHIVGARRAVPDLYARTTLPVPPSLISVGFESPPTFPSATSLSNIFLTSWAVLAGGPLSILALVDTTGLPNCSDFSEYLLLCPQKINFVIFLFKVNIISNGYCKKRSSRNHQQFPLDDF